MVSFFLYEGYFFANSFRTKIQVEFPYTNAFVFTFRNNFWQESDLKIKT